MVAAEHWIKVIGKKLYFIEWKSTRILVAYWTRGYSFDLHKRSLLKMIGIEAEVVPIIINNENSGDINV